jgi:hypothetical protein
MWFGWSLPVWETIFFCVTAAAAVLGAVSLMSAFASAIIGYKISDVVTTDASVKIADANARQKEAEEKIEQLKSENMKMQRLLAPRRAFMLPDTPEARSALEELWKYKGTPVILQAIPDWEANKLAGDLYEVLVGNGWLVKRGSFSESTFLPTEIFDGITVHSRPGSPVSRGQGAGMAVKSWLDATGVNPTRTALFGDLAPSNQKDAVHSISAPEDIVLILVGLKPVAAMLGHPWIDMQIRDPNNPMFK